LFFRAARSPYVLALAIFVGLAARLFLIIRSGNMPEGVLGGGSDAPAYILLGNSIFQGYGMAYVGQPTALRAPLYPLLLAALRFAFGSQSLLVMRFLQFLGAILAAWLCAKTAVLLWNKQSQWPAFAIALCVPTLVFFTSQILTESFTALLVAAFLYYLARYNQNEDSASLVAMGVCSGLLLLLRFNSLFIPAIAALAATRLPFTSASLKRAVLPIALSLALVSPWLIRNLIVFHGGILYSSQTGTTAFQGALAPEGRTQPQGLVAMQKRQGWWLSQIETDKPVRLEYPSEIELNRQARTEAIRAWSELGIQAVPLLLKKTSYFWLSTDQLLDTGSFSGSQRKLRAAGVVIYWAILTAAIIGWFRLRKVSHRIASLFLLYCLFATILHLPFTMNTRLRSPLIDPLLCVLAAVAVSPALPAKPPSSSAANPSPFPG
jgi:4-amino-4-deoxy-L-arabinose transferase-like glycosyltransferase